MSLKLVAKQTAALREEEIAPGDCVNMGLQGQCDHARSWLRCGGRDRCSDRDRTRRGHAARRNEGQDPLQRRLARFGCYLGLAVLAICGIVFTAGLLQGQPPMLMFLTAVSLAVAAIPRPCLL